MKFLFCFCFLRFNLLEGGEIDYFEHPSNKIRCCALTKKGECLFIGADTRFIQYYIEDDEIEPREWAFDFCVVTCCAISEKSRSIFIGKIFFHAKYKLHHNFKEFLPCFSTLITSSNLKMFNSLAKIFQENFFLGGGGKKP